MSTSRHSVLPPGGVAYVTGGARGLGFAVACSFAREGCSAVVIVDVLPDDVMQKSSTEITNLGAKVSHFLVMQPDLRAPWATNC